MIEYPLYFKKRNTRVVHVGNTTIGGSNPIRLQSMITNFTRNIDACVNEMLNLAQVGSELIRITIPNRKDLEAAQKIIERLRNEGCTIPLVADVHFSPNLAEEACEFFDKVRINPGNFADKSKSVQGRFQNGDDFLDGKAKLKEALKPLIFNLKKYKRALRVGVNQGSLSLRMIEKYGDTPIGMVQSALETIAFLEEEDFFDIIISLKSSNPLIVQQAYRLMSQSLEEHQNYPFHLGVTEAGNEIIGRIKSVCGIGALLADGIGDTIRVSLTEPSQNEIIFAKDMLQCLSGFKQKNAEKDGTWRRQLNNMRLNHEPLTLKQLKIGQSTPIKLGVLKDEQGLDTKEYDWDFSYSFDHNQFSFEDQACQWVRSIKELEPMEQIKGAALLFDSSLSIYQIREIMKKKAHQNKSCGYLFPEKIGKNDFTQEIKIAQLIGEGLIDFILLHPLAKIASYLRFTQIMQATRVKLMTPDYIACPSCGRTLFNIQDVVSQIKKATGHLKNIKIAVMGCIVNGPGEMADADFGYVGAATGKIDLYKGHEKVRRGVHEAEAITALIELIQKEGMWSEPDCTNTKRLSQ